MPDPILPLNQPANDTKDLGPASQNNTGPFPGSSNNVKPADDAASVKPADDPKPYVDNRTGADKVETKPSYDQDTRPASGGPEAVGTEAKLDDTYEKHLGPDVTMINGEPEMGVGSKYQSLHPAHKAHIAAIKHLIEVEAEHAAAETHLNAIHARVEHAKARVDETEKASNEEAAKEAKDKKAEDK